jgi:hypothetical protein
MAHEKHPAASSSRHLAVVVMEMCCYVVLQNATGATVQQPHADWFATMIRWICPVKTKMIQKMGVYRRKNHSQVSPPCFMSIRQTEDESKRLPYRE